MSVESYSVIIRCENCDEIIRRTGNQADDATASFLRARIQSIGWNAVNDVVEGERVVKDYCPSCSYELEITGSK